MWAKRKEGSATCGDPDPACLMVLYGHQARVFSVHLSPGKVYSAGEDGCCLVWDWSRGGGGKVAQTLKGHRAGGIRALAVSQGREEDGTRASPAIHLIHTSRANADEPLFFSGGHNIASELESFMGLIQTGYDTSSIQRWLQELKGNIRVFCRVRPLVGGGPSLHILLPPDDHKALVLARSEEPPQFKLDPRLARMLGIHTQTRPVIIQALWQYVKTHKLQDPHEREFINCDKYLQQIFETQRMKFSEIP
ncbi:unnamed protein product, partial [Boreogadus saida]